jgi:hypothetical protein
VSQDITEMGLVPQPGHFCQLSRLLAGPLSVGV